MATFVLRSEVKSLEIMVADLFTGVQRLAQAVAVLSEQKTRAPSGGAQCDGFVLKSRIELPTVDSNHVPDQVIYLQGLLEPLATEVRKLRPRTLNEAMSMARGIMLLKSTAQYSKSEPKKEMESVQYELKKETESGQNELKHVLGARANGEEAWSPTTVFGGAKCFDIMNCFCASAGLQMAGQLQIWDPGPRTFYMIGVDVNAKSWEAYDPFRDINLGFFSIQWDKIIEGEVLNVAGQEAYLITLPWLNDGRSSLGSFCGMLRIENWIQRIAMGTHRSLEDIYNMWMKASRAILDGQSEGESFDLKHLSTRHGIAIAPQYYGISYSAELLNQVGVIVHGSCSKILIKYSELKDQMSSASFLNMMAQESLVKSGGLNGLFLLLVTTMVQKELFDRGCIGKELKSSSASISCLNIRVGSYIFLMGHIVFAHHLYVTSFSCSGWYARTRCLQRRGIVVDLILARVEAHPVAGRPRQSVRQHIVKAGDEEE